MPYRLQPYKYCDVTVSHCYDRFKLLFVFSIFATVRVRYDGIREWAAFRRNSPATFYVFLRPQSAALDLCEICMEAAEGALLQFAAFDEKRRGTYPLVASVLHRARQQVVSLFAFHQ